MNTKRILMMSMIAVLALLVLSACASKSTEILAEDYGKMNDEQILEYFYRLNDEIEKQEKSSGPSFGIGIGGGGRGLGGGVGVGTGGTGYTAEDLRKRRVEVRMELKRRNITP